MPVLGNCIPFQSSASVFSPVHSAFAIGIAFASQAWRNFVSFPIDSALNAAGFPGTECWAKWECVWSHSLSSGPVQYLSLQCLCGTFEGQALSCPLECHLSDVLLRAKCEVSSIDNFPCHLGRFPTWLLRDWLYPVLWKQDELGCECRPEALSIPFLWPCWLGAEKCMTSLGNLPLSAANPLSLQNDVFSARPGRNSSGAKFGVVYAESLDARDGIFSPGKIGTSLQVMSFAWFANGLIFSLPEQLVSVY